MKGHKRIVCFMLIIVSFIAFNISADNETSINNKIKNLEKKLKDNTKNKEDVMDLMDDIEVELEKMNIEIEKLDYKLEKINSLIAENDSNIASLEGEIDSLSQDLITTEKELEHKKVQYSSQVRFWYTMGTSNILELIFSSKDLSASMSTISFMDNLNKNTKDLFNEISDDIAKIEETQVQLKSNKKDIESLKAKNLEKRDEIQHSRNLQADLINKAESKRSQYKKTLTAYNILKTNTEKEIELEKQRLIVLQNRTNISDDTSTDNPTGDKIIALASKFLGTPYLWAGDRPYDGTPGSGFDCSGLVQYVYKQFGITTGRRTYDQIVNPNGRWVSRDNLRAGDLVFFGTESDPHHVGLYVGNNKYLHAPRTGDYIKISPMTRPDYVEGRRFIPD